ncbi:uncharacterized vacuolar membrane protein YML018C-like isoform X3 [Actinidia eriantha]|uniref:uncharacterized vacuolar membrane protein YML018C-like isoform X3 n=1 Tax=Actinidia eriantha TaxID=165200 RepID=UPI002584CFB5|nr:uncharacterized vacuolar membrane protein YML018C-like isoform X3 [Actinidia eriantha]
MQELLGCCQGRARNLLCWECHQKKKQEAGLFFILTVIIMWVSSAEVTQGIFEDYDHPFLMAYLGTSLLVLYLPIAFIKNGLFHFIRGRSNSSDDAENTDKSSCGIESPIKVDEGSEMENKGPREEDGNGMELKSQEEGMALETEQINIDVDKLKQDQELSNKEMARLGFYIAPIWFITEYLTNAALARTSVASTMVLTSTTGLFTLFMGAFFGQDSISIVKVVSVIISMAGVAMTTLGKTWSTDESHLSKSTNAKHSVVGDICALLSAMTYALFTVLLKKFTGEEGERVDMQKLYGYIGLFTLAALWWLIWPLTFIGIEPKFVIPHSEKTGGILLANCFVNSVLCDYFWAMGVVWTTPLVAALGVSLTIPLAMVADMVVHGQRYSAIYIIGSAQVFVGFVMAGFSDWISQKLRL